MICQNAFGQGGFAHLSRTAEKNHFGFQIGGDVGSQITHLAILFHTPKQSRLFFTTRQNSQLNHPFSFDPGKAVEKIATIQKPLHKPFDMGAKETVYSFKTVMPRLGA